MCIPAYEDEIQVITHLIQSFQVSEPEVAAQLSVDELANLLEQANESKEDLEIILQQYAQVRKHQQ